MSADFKSHVLLRDEKGFLGIPFKRLLLAAVGGGLVYTIIRFASAGASIPTGTICGITLLIMTGMRGGLPLWQRLLYQVRGALLLAAAQQPSSSLGKLAAALELPSGLAKLDGAVVFASLKSDVGIDLREWTLFTSPVEADHDDGLRFVSDPLEEVS
jgi:hypothetical protein